MSTAVQSRNHRGHRRTLRILKCTPIALAICEACNSQFHSRQPLEDDAEAEMTQAFDAHECSGEQP